MNPDTAFFDAIEEYNPVEILLLFSGGHDSLCSTHWAASNLDRLGVAYKVYHGDTGTGIKETQDYVKSVCKLFGWELAIRKPEPPNDYETLVKRFGFPGESQHPIMYRNLKEKPLRKYVTHECKSSPHSRENVLLVTGVRKQESRIRMGWRELVRKDGSRVWTCPIFDWSEKECEGWMKAHDLPRNPVKDNICISGECLCGCFGRASEAAEIKATYPDAWARIEALEKYSAWPWFRGRSTHEKHHPPGQAELPFMPMCVGCEEKNSLQITQ